VAVVLQMAARSYLQCTKLICHLTLWFNK
jgi:hypothetical protein